MPGLEADGDKNPSLLIGGILSEIPRMEIQQTQELVLFYPSQAALLHLYALLFTLCLLFRVLKTTDGAVKQATQRKKLFASRRS